MDNITIEKVILDDLPCYNTAFHKPCEHLNNSNDVQEVPYLSTFIDLLKRQYWTYSFDENECKILIDYAKVGSCTLDRRKVLPDAYDSYEELDAIIERLSNAWISGRWFIRFDGRSPKDGRWEFPLVSAADTIEQIITSARALYALTSDHSDKLYFVEFKDHWQKHQEFRVFICNGLITAISQYYTQHTYYKNFSDDMLKQIVGDIQNYVGQNLFQPNCTIDVHYVIETRELELVEVGSFGYTTPTGSALFDWISDYNKLYGIEIGRTYIRINVGSDEN
jgi:hypothetical protein